MIWSEYLMVVSAWASNIMLTHYVWKRTRVLKNEIDQVRFLVHQMIKGREKFYESLTDPDKIMADMERGAVAMEALSAKRHRNIRDDAGPHARVYKPRKFGQLPKKR